MLWQRLTYAASLALILSACSSVHYVYQAKGYQAQPQGVVKRIHVSSWSPIEHQALAPVLKHVTEELIKLRKNYLVLPDEPDGKGGFRTCKEGAEGVLLVRALEVGEAKEGAKMKLALALELTRCHDGALIFRSEGVRQSATNDSHLSEMTRSYQDLLGPSAGPYIAPSFALLQELIAPLFNPTLTDADIEEKIELGYLFQQP